MSTAHERRELLHQLLKAPRLTVAPSCFNPLTGRLIEDAGFDAVHVSGGAISRFHAFPDVGLLTMNEMVALQERIVEATTVPIIGDGETGFGGPLHTRRTIRAYERAGLAAIHIEDEFTPKKSGGSSASHAAIPTLEMVDKLKAALDARTDQKFIIIARTNARDSESCEQVMDRIAAYTATGVDAVWPGINHPEEIKRVRDYTHLPLVGVPRRGPGWLAAYEQYGFRVACIAGILGLAASVAMGELLEIFKKTGSDDEYWKQHPGTDTWKRWFNAVGQDEEKP